MTGSMGLQDEGMPWRSSHELKYHDQFKAAYPGRTGAAQRED
jgi:hypothetical protein